MQTGFWEVMSAPWSQLTQHKLEFAQISVPIMSHLYRNTDQQPEPEKANTLLLL